MNSFQFNIELNVLETKKTGAQTILNIIEHYNEITKNNNLPKILNVIIDCRGASFDIKANEIDYTQEAVNNALNKYERIKEAILVDKPYETAIATLFKNYNSDLKSYSFKIFSTEEAAKKWLIQKNQ